MDTNISYLDAANWDDSIWERLDWLRDNEPVYWSEKDQVFVVTRFEDVSYVSKNQQLFTSGQSFNASSAFSFRGTTLPPR